MGTICISKKKNEKNSETSDPVRLMLNLADKISLKRSDKYNALSNLDIYYTQKNTKRSYKRNKFKISASALAPAWNDGTYL